MQKEIKLSKISTKAPKSMKKEDLITPTMELYERIGHLQHILYAEKKHSVLIVFQGPDASGKDGATKNVFSRCSPQGVRVEAFKKPSEEEMNHDFLWRIHANTPEKGFIQVFNRSHYEDILIQRVHKWIDEDRVHKRMAAINAFEELLNLTTIHWSLSSSCTSVKTINSNSLRKGLRSRKKTGNTIPMTGRSGSYGMNTPKPMNTL